MWSFLCHEMCVNTHISWQNRGLSYHAVSVTVVGGVGAFNSSYYYCSVLVGVSSRRCNQSQVASKCMSRTGPTSGCAGTTRLSSNRKVKFLGLQGLCLNRPTTYRVPVVTRGGLRASKGDLLLPHVHQSAAGPKPNGLSTSTSSTLTRRKLSMHHPGRSRQRTRVRKSLRRTTQWHI